MRKLLLMLLFLLPMLAWAVINAPTESLHMHVRSDGQLVHIITSAYPSPVIPGQPKFSWHPPTEFTDNSSLDPDTDIAKYQVFCDPQIVATDIVINTGEPNEWLAPVGVFGNGVYSCSITAVGIDGVSSSNSNAVTFLIK